MGKARSTEHRLSRQGETQGKRHLTESVLTPRIGRLRQVAAWPGLKAAGRGKLSAAAARINSAKPVQARPLREGVWAKTWAEGPACLEAGWEVRGWPETGPAWAARAPGWREEWEDIPVTADHRWPVEWAVVRASAVGCRWGAAGSGERQWAEVRRWEVASVAAWEWEAAASAAAAWEEGAVTEEGAAVTAKCNTVRLALT
jgi:hypothetical protein